jgi:hypothetical protein
LIGREEREKLMKSIFRIHLKLSAALLLVSVGVHAQEGPPPPGPGAMRHGGEPGGPGPFGERAELMGFEGLHGGKTVTGAPFSATAITETTQTLSDGTVLHRTATSNVYRDSQGRSRREVTLAGFGPLATTGKTRTMVSIADPVAGAHYALEPDQKTAFKMPMRKPASGSNNAENSAAFEQKMQARLEQDEATGTVKEETLTDQMIAGVSAEGTRITRTIPVGQIGNDKPFAVVFERWYSPDLQIVVKSTRTDPRFGTTTYTVTNLHRAEPAASLFTVPTDYTVKAGGHGGPREGHGGPPPAPASN